MLIILFLLKALLLILNKELLRQSKAIRSILLKKIIAYLVLLTTKTLKVTLLQKEFVLEIIVK